MAPTNQVPVKKATPDNEATLVACAHGRQLFVVRLGLITALFVVGIRLNLAIGLDNCC